MNDVKQNSKEMDRESTGSSQKNRKSKRIVAFDFLRGGAIIGVLGFHVLNIVYEYSLDDAPIWFYILVLILGFFGSLYTLFILVSAVGNTFSMHSRWEKLTAGGDNAELNDKAFKHILKTQLTRGAVITFLGYFSESILNGMLLGS